MIIQRNNLLILLAALLCSPLVNLHSAAEGRTLNSVNTSTTVSPDNNPNNHPQIKNIMFPGQKKIFLNNENIFWPPAIPIDLNQECPISNFSFFEHFKMFPMLIVAAVETEGGNMRFYNGASISSWLLNNTLTAPKRNLIDLLDQSHIIKISYFLLSSLEEDFQFLCTLDDLISTETNTMHKYYRHILLATGGKPEAQSNLGKLYESSYGLLGLTQEEGIRKALICYQAATDQGDPDAKYNQAVLYYSCWEILNIPSEEEAVILALPLFLAAAGQDHALAKYSAAYHYQHHFRALGLSLKEGVQQALSFYQLAAEHEDVRFHRESITRTLQDLRGLGFPQQEGLQFLQFFYCNKADFGGASAKYNLGCFLQNYWQDVGHPEPLELLKVSMKLYQKAAGLGDTDAQNNLGFLYEIYWEALGLTEEQALEQARACYEQAAQNNHHTAQLNVIYLSENITQEHKQWFDNIPQEVHENYAANHPARFEAIETKIRNFNENQAEQN